MYAQHRDFSCQYLTRKEKCTSGIKKRFLLIMLFVLSLQTLKAQDTFSIVAIDSVTREVGSAGASCLSLYGWFESYKPDFITVLIPDRGVINTQGAWLTENQSNATQRLLMGDSPQQIISWLQSNDFQGNPNSRQYGVAAFTGAVPQTAAYTGVNCNNYKNHITGHINSVYYSIQGNILQGQHILDSMESRFRNAAGNLACRLMAGLQGANVVAADTRCINNNTSSLFAFLNVAQPTDPDTLPGLHLGVKTAWWDSLEPIDSLQILFDQVEGCTPLYIKNIQPPFARVYPNPGKGLFIFKTSAPQKEKTFLEMYNHLGIRIFTGQYEYSPFEIDMSKKPAGAYYYKIYNRSGSAAGKLIIE